jgi:hypothetical protein
MMDTTMKQYKPLERRIKKGDIDALMARWEFGRKLSNLQRTRRSCPAG